MMKFFLFAILASFGLFQSASIADSNIDLTNGNLIAEPTLQDYARAERTPGFSETFDIVDSSGNSETF